MLELTLGSVPPELSINASDNLSSTDVKADGMITLDLGFKWAGDPNIVILLKSHGIPLVPAQLKKFQLYGPSDQIIPLPPNTPPRTTCPDTPLCPRRSTPPVARVRQPHGRLRLCSSVSQRGLEAFKTGTRSTPLCDILDDTTRRLHAESMVCAQARCVWCWGR